MNQTEIAVDSAGDVFITDAGNNRVLELPRTATGYGPQITLPFAGLSGPGGVALDSAGNLFITDGVRLTAARGIAVDRDGLRGADHPAFQRFGCSPRQMPWTAQGMCSSPIMPMSLAAELPKTSTGYGAQVTLPFTGLSQHRYSVFLRAMAVDSEINVFLVDMAITGCWNCRGQGRATERR